MKDFNVLMFLMLSVNTMRANTQRVVVDNQEQLNVIVLLVDDMGYGDIAAHGNPIIKTPNFDSFHDKSVRFTNFAVSPTSAPTRCALLSGKHEFLSSVTHTIEPMRNMDLETVCFPELFQKAGYQTGLFGKWHLGQTAKYGPWYRGFDETLVVRNDFQNSHYNPTLLKNQLEVETEGYRTDILFDAAMEFIDDNKQRPFFCYLATYSPHAPCVVPEKYSEPYEQYADSMSSIGYYNAKFNGMITNVDENLGRLIDKVKTAGSEENTLIIVLSDNGGTFGVDTFNDGHRGVKATLWSGGVRAYSFWKLGEKFHVGERSQMTGHVDIFPTVADFCNLDIPRDVEKELEGNSLKDLLYDPSVSLDEDRMQVHHLGRWKSPGAWRSHKYSSCSVRWKNYILVRIEPCKDDACKTCKLSWDCLSGRPMLYSAYQENYKLTYEGQWELYDLETDPFQSNDIANKHPDIVDKLSNHYDAWWSKVGNHLSEK